MAMSRQYSDLRQTHRFTVFSGPHAGKCVTVVTDAALKLHFEYAGRRSDELVWRTTQTADIPVSVFGNAKQRQVHRICNETHGKIALFLGRELKPGISIPRDSRLVTHFFTPFLRQLFQSRPKEEALVVLAQGIGTQIFTSLLELAVCRTSMAVEVEAGRAHTAVKALELMDIWSVKVPPRLLRDLHDVVRNIDPSLLAAADTFLCMYSSVEAPVLRFLVCAGLARRASAAAIESGAVSVYDVNFHEEVPLWLKRRFDTVAKRVGRMVEPGRVLPTPTDPSHEHDLRLTVDWAFVADRMQEAYWQEMDAFLDREEARAGAGALCGDCRTGVQAPDGIAQIGNMNLGAVLRGGLVWLQQDLRV